MENRIDAVLTDADRDNVLTIINDIRARLPFLIDLTIEDRQSLPKMGDKSRAFVSQALALAEQNDEFLPRSFDVTEMRRDVDLTTQLLPILTALAQLVELVEDTYLLAGSDAYSAALIVYSSAKRNGQGEALDNLLDALGQRFARKSKGNPPTP
ncbi:MAG TPA: hypothetical protein PKE69_07065 [Pyrinomonadaceae bacterium]|nr:hypothetical protein [Pyrinomonadaceae bacterium]